ncbi:hypothetical protein ACFLU8_02555 [Chloroflexota bacterium]
MFKLIIQGCDGRIIALIPTMPKAFKTGNKRYFANSPAVTVDGKYQLTTTIVEIRRSKKWLCDSMSSNRGLTFVPLSAGESPSDPEPGGWRPLPKHIPTPKRKYGTPALLSQSV